MGREADDNCTVFINCGDKQAPTAQELGQKLSSKEDAKKIEALEVGNCSFRGWKTCSWRVCLVVVLCALRDFPERVKTRTSTTFQYSGSSSAAL